MNEQRTAAIRRQLIGFDWSRYNLNAVPEATSYDWAYDLAAAIDSAIAECAADDVWTREDDR